MALVSCAVASVVSRQLVDVIEVERSVRVVSGSEQKLRTCDAEPWGLYTVQVAPEDPFVVLERSWLLPAAGVRIRRRWAPGENSCPLTAVGAVRVEGDERRWHTTDLVLGLEVPTGRAARVAHADDFAAAVAGGVLTPADADQAMGLVHRVLGELVAHRHDLLRWAQSYGVALS